MIITFILPNVAWGKKSKFFRIEPAIFAKLKALTPNDIECRLFDTRIEDIDYRLKTDIVVISTTTLTASSAYKIADKYRKRNIKVAIGGIHADLCPEDVLEHADIVISGESEILWPQFINDLKNGELKQRYQSNERYDMKNYKLDYSIFKGKNYLPFHIIETSRGCKFKCNFCSLTPLYKQIVIYRPIDEIVEQIKSIKGKYLYFIDDNFGSDIIRAKELLKRIKPYKKKWFTHISVNYLQDEEFVKLLHESGCINVFIGFESIDKNALQSMDKAPNININWYNTALNYCAKYDISINAGFISAALEDTPESVNKTFEFANSFQFAMINFVNLIPLPGTPLYNTLYSYNKLIYEKWWLEDIMPYRTVLFKHDNFKEENFADLGYESILKVQQYKNIFKRFWKSKYKFDTRLKILLFNLGLKLLYKKILF